MSRADSPSSPSNQRGIERHLLAAIRELKESDGLSHEEIAVKLELPLALVRKFAQSRAKGGGGGEGASHLRGSGSALTEGARSGEVI